MCDKAIKVRATDSFLRCDKAQGHGDRHSATVVQRVNAKASL